MITLATLICCGEPDWAEMPQTDASFRRNTGILKRRFDGYANRRNRLRI
jgi:hypothetical protein